MRSAPHLFNEDERLAALAEYDLAGEGSVDLDEIVELAARLFDVPIVLISVIARERQFVKAGVGLDVCEWDRQVSFCAHALGYDEIMVVPDATLDIRFAANPFVTGEPNIRFYAGMPLRSPSGEAIGTFCLIDRVPRRGLSDRDRTNLRSLAALVLDKLELRRLAVAGAAGQSRFENIASTSPDGIVCADGAGRITFWNAGAERLFGFPVETALGAPIDIIVPPRMRGGHVGGLTRVAAGGAPRLVGSTVDLDAARADGTEFPIELSLSMWREDGVASFGAIIRDLSERRANEERLFALAHLDPLTGLPNRGVLSRRIVECVASADQAAVLLIDLDGFKDVNDTLGHSAGDAVLKEIGRRILGCSRDIDTVARLGGDEFAILMPKAPQCGTIGQEADCLLARLAEPIEVEGQTVHLSGSIGISLYPADGAHAEDLLSAADLALYQAKNEGRNCRRFFNPKLREAAVRRRAFEVEVRQALRRGEFELFYQPQVRIADGVTLGVEALLRWHHLSLGLIGPDRFLQSVDLSPQAADLGQWVLEQACRDAVRLRRNVPHLRMGVNLFGSQFRTGRLAEDVRKALDDASLPAGALELEITENIILRHDETMLEPLHRIRKMGVGVAFDDFGTGFASLMFLKRFPLSRIKIDRSFVSDICADPRDAAIVNATVYLACALDLEVIAEGVETADQAAFLRGCGCGVAQGYLYGRPMPIAQACRALLDGKKAAA
jgi:diguanylate cyclase (GGDEF)-like protein/PAS domain S-box-containing protein